MIQRRRCRMFRRRLHRGPHLHSLPRPAAVAIPERVSGTPRESVPGSRQALRRVHPSLCSGFPVAVIVTFADDVANVRRLTRRRDFAFRAAFPIGGRRAVEPRAVLPTIGAGLCKARSFRERPGPEVSSNIVTLRRATSVALAYRQPS
jgi:hypothetical protein